MAHDMNTPAAEPNGAAMRGNIAARSSLSSTASIHADPMTRFSDRPAESRSDG